MKKKGQVMYFFTFIIVIVFISIIAAIAIPAGVELTDKVYEIGDSLLRQSNDTVKTIVDDTLREGMQPSINAAIASTNTNNLLINQMQIWVWIIMIMLAGLIIFMAAQGDILVQQRSSGGGLV